MTQAVLFDLDGTLVDTSVDILNAINQLLKNYQLPPKTLAEIKPHISAGGHALLRLAFDHQDIDYDDRHAELLGYRKSTWVEQSHTFPGIPELLKQIVNHGLRWGVVSNHSHTGIEHILAELKLDKDCSCMVGYDDVGQLKPNPASLQLACEQLSLETQACVYVGDAHTDMQAAQACGMPAVIAAYGFISPTPPLSEWPADFVIEKPLDLLNYLGIKLDSDQD